MPEFLYKARDLDGKVVEGVVEATSMGDASTVLADRNLTVITLVPRAEKKLYELNLGNLFSGIKSRDIVIFSRQLAVLVSANVSIVQSLHTVQRQTTSVKLRAIIGDAANDVEAGGRLSASLAKYPKAFTPFYTNMIRSGETSGQVETVLNYLADQLEKDYDMISKVKGSMYYPAFIVSAMLAIGFAMMTFVVPQLTSSLTEAGGALPWPTLILVAVSGFFAAYWWAMLIVIAAAIATVAWYLSTPAGKRVYDRFTLRVPIFGGIFQRLAVVRMVRSMKTLLDGGVDSVSALEVTADVVGNAIYHDIIMETIKEVRDGRSLATVFQKHPKTVPPMVSQMFAVGEETGKLSDILDRLGSFYSREIDNLIGGLVTLIEPVIILLIGVAVLLMVAAIVLPMFALDSAY